MPSKCVEPCSYINIPLLLQEASSQYGQQTSTHLQPLQPQTFLMTRKPPFGRSFREKHFAFSPQYTPLNHGSFGAYPKAVQEQQDDLQRQCHERPDTFIVSDLPELIDKSRTAVAPLLGVNVDEVVFVPNATTGVNTVLRNLEWREGDVVIHFSTIYSACEKTLASISELTPLEAVNIPLQYPIEDAEVVTLLREKIAHVSREGKRVKLAMFDTVLTFPGVRMPWEQLVTACHELEVLSLIDGAHGIGHIDLTHLGHVSPDFFVSNCHKWLYTPRGCAVFHVPLRNQHLIRTSLPTSHGYEYLSSPSSLTPAAGGNKSPFVHLFEFVATIDYTPYCCIPSSLSFRQRFCGGEESIRAYCFSLAQVGGEKVAKVLKTHTLDNATSTVSQCCFTNVALPVTKPPRANEELEIARWINKTAVHELDTYLQLAWHAGILWVRLSAQIYLGKEDFDWIAEQLESLCERVEAQEWKKIM